MQLVSIVGARPQIIKAAAVSRAIAGHNKKYSDRTIFEIILHTGQHYDRSMSQVFFEELDVPQPDYNLGVGGGSHGEQTGKMLQRIEAVLAKDRPDCCLVYGDTNSTLAGALAAAKLHIPVAHVEAGLRSFNRRMPEEINRVVTDHISELLFCPTQTSVDNLAKEGISAGVHRVGDVMYDCILFYTKKTRPIEQKILEALHIQSKSYCLATVHRAENTDDGKRLSNIFEALNEIASKDRPVVLPLHPRTIKHTRQHSLEFADWVKVIKPVSYLEMVALENNAGLILTDSGGVQKEAYWLGVPCITLRDETEWVETVESGWNILTGADKHRIINGVRRGHRRRDLAPDLVYGNGNAANQICDVLQRS
jgi:UDP-GlcNAc3NAcA epimerase